MDKIVTSYWAKPIPPREFDWCAYFDGAEESGPIGHGRTEAEAVADLMQQMSDGDE